MRRFIFGMAFIVFAAAGRAEDAADQPVLVLNTGGHTAPITRVLFAAEGKEVVTVSMDKTVRRWDAATGELLGVYYLPAGPGDQGQVWAAALSPDGKALAVSGFRYMVGGQSLCRIYLLDPADGHVTATLPGFNNDCLAFSHDGKLLAAGNSDQAQILDVASGKILHVLTARTPDKSIRSIGGLAFSPNDKALAVAAYSAGAHIYSVETGEETCPPIQHKSGCYSVAWKDDNTLATGGGGGGEYIRLWDARGKPLRKFDKPPHHQARITSLAFLPGNEELCYSFEQNESPEYAVTGGAVLNLANPDKSRDGVSSRHRFLRTSAPCRRTAGWRPRATASASTCGPSRTASRFGAWPAGARRRTGPAGGRTA